MQLQTSFILLSENNMDVSINPSIITLNMKGTFNQVSPAHSKPKHLLEFKGGGNHIEDLSYMADSFYETYWYTEASNVLHRSQCTWSYSRMVYFFLCPTMVVARWWNASEMKPLKIFPMGVSCLPALWQGSRPNAKFKIVC